MNLWQLPAILVVALGGCCCGPIEYAKGPHGGMLAVDPERLKVETNDFPQFRTRYDFKPPPVKIPITMVEILSTDTWEIAYRTGKDYLLVSKAYNDRQCRALSNGQHRDIASVSRFTGRCVSRYFYSIYVDLTGNVTGGWALLFNPEVVISSSARAINLIPDPTSISVWGSQPLFESVTAAR